LHREDLRAVRAVGKALPQVTALCASAFLALKRGGRLIYVGAGSSGRLGVLDAAECPPTFGTRGSQVQAVLAGGARAFSRAVEGAEDDLEAGARAVRQLRVSAKDLVCGISASSLTPFVRGALREAKRRRATTALISSSNSAKRLRADITVIPNTGPELIAGSTRLKAGTATKLILNAVSTAAMVALGTVYRGRMIDLRTSNAKLRARAVRMVSDLTALTAADADRLLQRASGKPRTALAMHMSQSTRARAEQLLKRRGLRELEKEFN
jgi:N-acetylmuramic acid 6-phosphate etherase